jgi:hypothetical protein
MISINGKERPETLQAGAYAVIRREWRNGDRVRLSFFPGIEVKTWEKQRNSVSVRRGPLWFALRIGEEWKRYGGTDLWPAYEVLPTTPWNYGLVVDPGNPAATIQIVDRKPPKGQPFSFEAAPLVLRARARRLPEWKSDGKMAGLLPASPVISAEPEVDIMLIPMGCARLRIASFPQVTVK